MAQESRTHRVLVVDDEALIRWSLTETLADQGFRVEEAATGSAAIETVATASNTFDVVLLDLRLPDSNDLTVMKKLRQLAPGTAVILMTAFSTPDVVQGAFDLGAFRVVSKPFEMTDIASLVNQAC